MGSRSLRRSTSSSGRANRQCRRMSPPLGGTGDRTALVSHTGPRAAGASRAGVVPRGTPYQGRYAPNQLASCFVNGPPIRTRGPAGGA